jgi:hypothetical protein
MLKSREQRAASRAAELTSPGADLAAEPPDVRQTIAKLHAADAPEERAAFQSELLEKLTRQLDDEIAGMRRRLAGAREGIPQKVDRRVREIVGRAERAGRP